ncbi:MAG: LysR family transcriptional regulator [Pseudomonadota bacterium]
MAAPPDAQTGPLDWGDYGWLLTTARAGSLRAAAAVLGVDEATASRRLARIEHALGAPVFQRTQRGVTPTTEGNRLLAIAEQMESSLHASWQHTVDSELVRVTAVPIVTNHLLLPALPSLSQSSPDTTLELIAEHQSLHLGRQDADLAIRLSRPRRDAASLCKRMGHLHYATYQRRTSGSATSRWIGQRSAQFDLPQDAHAKELASSGSVRLFCNDNESVLQAVRLGYGQALLPVPVARRFGDVERCHDGVELSREVWLMTRAGCDGNAIDAVKTWLADTFSSALQDTAS